MASSEGGIAAPPSHHNSLRIGDIVLFQVNSGKERNGYMYSELSRCVRNHVIRVYNLTALSLSFLSLFSFTINLFSLFSLIVLLIIS